MAVKGLARDRKKTYSYPIKCRKCGLPGGTLVKVGDEYEHQDKEKCRILQLRKR